ncbi:MAG TPA: hypothetical protein PLZ09_00655 [Clostridia bacterium]|nr:hypothetical protein [Clostridia bacterium]
MLNILSAISTETIIGIVAIVVIVISSGIIIATAIRNYLLHKKAVIEAEKNEGFEGDTPIQEIEENVQDESAEVNAANVVVTAEEAEDSNNIIEVPAEFAEEDEQEEEIQEINFEKNPEKPDESKVENGLDDISTDEVDDKSMDELMEKLANR